ncbi:MAG TPA: hypothetical protein VLF66_00850, partial [Thermoanaerobaculia bacterium]|nr:hypothetical protein [Thermoanaerobaculia bacterium]
MRRSRTSIPAVLRAPAVAGCLALLAAAGAPALAAPPPPPGPLGVHALTGARIVTAPGAAIESGTVVIRDGVIEAVGTGVEPPPDARVWELEGATVYAGLIEPFALQARAEEGGRGEERQGGGEASDPGAGHPNPVARPEREMAGRGIEAAAAGRLREAGFTTAAVAPGEGVLRGWSAVVNLGD